MLSKKLKKYLLKKITRKHRIPFDNSSIKKVLFLRYDRIGDMIISTPVFRELKKNIPEIEISILSSKDNYEVVRYNKYIDKIFFNHKKNLLSDIPTLLKLRKEKYDLCIEFDHSVIPHTIFRLKLINSRYVISPYKDGRYGVLGNEMQLYDLFSSFDRNIHARDNWLNLLSVLKVEIHSRNYEIFTNDEHSKKAKKFIQNISSTHLIGFNLEGAVKGKKIPVDDLYFFSKKIENDYPGAIIIPFCHPSKFDLLKNQVRSFDVKNILFSYPTNSILDVAEIIRGIDILITPDTSLVHIASCFNVPTISIHEKNKDSYNLFGPTSKFSRTVFSSEFNSLKGYDRNEVYDFLLEYLNTNVD